MKRAGARNGGGVRKRRAGELIVLGRGDRRRKDIMQHRVLRIRSEAQFRDGQRAGPLRGLIQAGGTQRPGRAVAGNFPLARSWFPRDKAIRPRGEESSRRQEKGPGGNRGGCNVATSL